MTVSATTARHGRGAVLLSGAFAGVMLGTTLPTALYPTYQARFGFGGLTVTVVYAVFAAGVLGALLLAGPAGDAIGRKRVMLPGLAAAGLSSMLFLAAGVARDGGLGNGCSLWLGLLRATGRLLALSVSHLHILLVRWCLLSAAI